MVLHDSVEMTEEIGWRASCLGLFRTGRVRFTRTRAEPICQGRDR